MNIIETPNWFWDPPDDDDDGMTDEEREAAMEKQGWFEEQDRIDYADRDFSDWQDCR
jgi:hypothetical protein